MHELFKYMMNVLHTRLIAEWQDFDISYPQWLTHVVLDELYYVIAVVTAGVVCFAMGMIIGIVWTVV